MTYRLLLRPRLFAIFHRDPEISHECALSIIRWIGKHNLVCREFHRRTTVADPRLCQDLLGLRFCSPIGLAAGFDKNGVAIEGLAALGFSHLELGTITPFPQTGNPRPRMFRFPQDQAIINRMGFNNEGAEAIKRRLQFSHPLEIPLGISLGMGKNTPLALADGDYRTVLNELYDYGDYFVINVSSPNTVGLRSLHSRGQLTLLIKGVQDNLVVKKPLLVKISPDLDWVAIDALVEVCLDHGVSGLIATNTTISRAGLSVTTTEAGGMSGQPLFPRALEVVRYLRRALPAGFPIIGGGGIMTAKNAYNMLKAGANLLQVYTGLVYGGPFFVKHINRGLLALMERDGITHVSQLHTSG